MSSPAALPARSSSSSTSTKESQILQSIDQKLPAPKTRKRKTRQEEESTTDEDSGHEGNSKSNSKSSRSKSEGSKGLRYLTKRVCAKVKAKTTTSYREVANELVAEAGEAEAPTGTSGGDPEPNLGEQKTVKRRVYDALNVLMAMGIIGKDKKDIKWIGIPNGDQLGSLASEKAEMEQRILKKKERLKELEVKKNLYKGLLARNLSQLSSTGPNQTAQSSSSSNTLLHHNTNTQTLSHPTIAPGAVSKLSLPLLIIHTASGSDVECEMTDDRKQFIFTFKQNYDICEDTELIRAMNLPDTNLDEETLLELAASAAAGTSGVASNNSNNNSNVMMTDMSIKMETSRDSKR